MTVHRSAFFCSAACLKAAWRQHKRDCGAHVPSSEWPIVSRALQRFYQKHGHYPGEEPAGACVRAAANGEKAGAAGPEQDAP